MSYEPTTDFLALLRLTAGGVRSERVPGLDFTVSALGRAGLISLFTGQTAPVVNPATTVWFKPAVPSWTGEGEIFIWNTGLAVYQHATPTLWSFLIASPFLSLIPQPGINAPLVDGVAAVGVSLLYARQDHVHPTDATRAPLDSPAFINNPTAPTAALGDNDNTIATTAFVIANGGLPPPIGSLIPYSGNVAPNANWQIAAGQAISRAGFPTLFTIDGITYGSGDGITTFNVPDLRGRVVAGVDAGANRLTTTTMSSQALAGTGGAETIVLTTPQIPTHLHGVTDVGHAHTIALGANLGVVLTAPASNGGSTGPESTSTNATGVVIQNAGGGLAHNNVQPTIELQYLIRVA